MAVVLKKYSGEKSPRNRSLEDALAAKVSVGAIVGSGLTAPPDTLIGNSAATEGGVQAITIQGLFTLEDGVLTLIADALTSEPLSQFASTTSEQLRSIINDAMGDGRLVFNVEPSLTEPTLVLPHIDGLTATTEPWVVGTNQFYKGATGGIGIGTVTPESLLEVQRNGVMDTVIQVTNTSTNPLAFARLRAKNGTSTIDLMVNHSSGYAELDPGGNVVEFRYTADTHIFRDNSGVELGRATTAAGWYLGPTPSTANSRLQVEGAISTPIDETAIDFTATNANSTIINAKAGSDMVLTLPAANTCRGRTYRVLNNVVGFAVVSASSNVRPRAGGANGTAIVAAGAGNWADLQSDGTQYRIIAGTP